MRSWRRERDSSRHLPVYMRVRSRGVHTRVPREKANGEDGGRRGCSRHGAKTRSPTPLKSVVGQLSLPINLFHLSGVVKIQFEGFRWPDPRARRGWPSICKQNWFETRCGRVKVAAERTRRMERVWCKRAEGGWVAGGWLPLVGLLLRVVWTGERGKSNEHSGE